MKTLKTILKIALKIIKVFLLLIFILIGGIMIYFQIKVETYKNQLIELYDFDYLKRERKRYHPFVVFYLYSKLYGKNKEYFRSNHYPYDLYDIKHNIIRKDNESYYVLSNIEYNAYLMYCYDFKRPE
ncbi:hypothetical protein [Bergeyella cardium]|uniref:Uncharacterized protein n=1 Tax=Bergeyella cardium TaxID=1585976 RepID=A0A6P1QWS0_9FLAO|nr:hypothetical protein [Bergeyella cardium]QHN65433.1 hypothetical protein DBX24_05825 [Bergeyella cardium]WHE33012.1 hypothetical protein P8603_05855 [Bergeyella cardium]WHF59663.1 hypothetical protein O0R51_05850 [Bergeyella cardium]